MEEVVLLDLKIEGGDADKALTNVLAKQQQLTQNTQALVAEQKKLKAQGQENSQQFQENAKQIVLNKQAISENNAEVKALTKSMQTEKGSIQDLVAQNKKLIQERNNINASTEEGRKKIDSINKSIDKNNAAIKDNVSALEKQKINVGDYTGALDKLVPGLGATATGFKATTAQMWLMVANPIGAVLAALALVLGGVVKFLTGTAEGQDTLNKIMAIGGAVIGKVSDAFTFLGKFAIQGVIDGFNLLIKGLDFLIPGFKEVVDLVGNKLNEALGDPIALANLKNRNDVLERELVLLKAVSEAKIAELKLRAEDKSLDLKERQAALKEALRLQNELSEKQTEFAANKLKIAQEEHSQSESSKADLLEEANLEADLFRIQKENSDKQKELFTKEQELRAQIRVAEQLAEADARAIRRAERELDSAEEISITSHTVDTNLSLRTKFATLATAIDKKFTDTRKKFAEDRTAFEIDSQEKQLAAVSRTAGQVAAIFDRESTAFKAAATVQALINTRAAAIAAYRAALSLGGPFGLALAVVAAAAATAFGLKQVAAINELKFAEGGVARGFTLGGKDHSRGGTKFIGSDGTRFEAQKDEGLFVLKREAHQDLLRELSERNTRFGGVSLTNQKKVRYAAQGGEIAAANIQTAQGGNDLGQIVDAISNLTVVVSVQEIAGELDKRAQIVELTTPIK